MELTDFYRKHFSDLCCYEDYLMRIDLMGKAHNDKEILDSLPKCDNQGFIIANGEIIWIDDNGEKVENPNITSISDHTFSYCIDIRRVVIPNGVKSIGECVFYGCSGLKSVTIPSSVTSIGDWAFSGCIGLESVTIPSSVKRISYQTFLYCDSLKSVRVPKNCEISRNVFPEDCKVMYY